MERLTALVTDANSFLWGLYCLIPLLVGTGIYFTLRLGFIQLKHFGQGWRHIFGNFSLSGKRAGDEGMSSFQAVATAIAAQVGTGNLAGAATAIALGGPGAIFWMYLAAFFGMATIYGEAVLAQTYKGHDESGAVVGGPAYYITNGLGKAWKPLAVFFSVATIIALGLIGPMVQSNSIADAFQSAFGLNKLVVGAVLAVLAGFVFFGGTGRIASFAEKVVPVMAFLYLLGGAYILVTHLGAIIPAIKSIFVGAFSPTAATGGLIGASMKEAIRYGVARGLFSNEAGMGSTPHAHAVAKVQRPAQQGLCAIVSVFIDTFLVLNMTALVILVTGALVPESDGGAVLNGIALTQRAFEIGLGQNIGYSFVAICLMFFAFTTIIGWYFFAEQNVKYLLGVKVLVPYRALVMVFLLVGAVLHLELVWQLADFFNGLMVFPNLIALLGLSKIVVKSLDQLNELDRSGNLKA